LEFPLLFLGFEDFGAFGFIFNESPFFELKLKAKKAFGIFCINSKNFFTFHFSVK